MILNKLTHRKLMFLGAAYALTGALMADLTGNLATAVFGLIGLIPLALNPTED